MSNLVNCSHDLRVKWLAALPSNSFCFTQLKIHDTFSDVLGMTNGQHVGVTPSGRSYSNQTFLRTACNGSSVSTQLYTDVIRISMILRCTLVQ